MKLMCDFCYSSEPVWEYQIGFGHMVATFSGGRQMVDDGEWLACEPCAVLIEIGDVPGIVARAIKGNAVRGLVLESGPLTLLTQAFLSEEKRRVPYIEGQGKERRA